MHPAVCADFIRIWSGLTGVATLKNVQVFMFNQPRARVLGKGAGATRTEYVDAWGFPQKPLNFTRGALKGGNLPEDIYRTFHTGLRSIMPSYGGETLGSITREGLEALVDEQTLASIESILDEFPANFDAMDELDRARFSALIERNSWDLVAYILSLRESTSTAAAVLGSAP